MSLSPPLSSVSPGEGERYDVVVVSTAALPWRTGPAIIGLWHACGLMKPGKRVAFGFPWLGSRSQKRLWGSVRFATPDAQIVWMKEEAQRLGCPGVPEMFTYRGVFSSLLRGIVPLEDVMARAPATRVLLLEEPEHLCWYPTTRRRKRIAADHVVGVVMTNYPYYVRHSGIFGAGVVAKALEAYHGHAIRTRTDLAVAISPLLPIKNLRHPTKEERITGALNAYAEVPPVGPETTGVYFLGRLVWEKGLRTLIESAAQMKQPMDILGDGPNRAAMEALALERKAPVRFLGGTASPWEVLENYRVFFNPSLSETLCTTILEALVAGRHVVLPHCPANSPFLDFPNVHFYNDGDERGLVQALTTALTTSPEPPDRARREFHWQAACNRLAALWGDGQDGTTP